MQRQNLEKAQEIIQQIQTLEQKTIQLKSILDSPDHNMVIEINQDSRGNGFNNLYYKDYPNERQIAIKELEVRFVNEYLSLTHQAIGSLVMELEKL